MVVSPGQFDLPKPTLFYEIEEEWVEPAVRAWVYSCYDSGDSLADVLATPDIPAALVGVLDGAASFSSMPPVHLGE